MICVSVQIENSAEEFALYIVHTSGGESAKKPKPSPAQPAGRPRQSAVIRRAQRRCFGRCREAEAASQRLPPDRPHPARPLRAGLQGLPHGEGPGGRSHLRREFAGTGCSSLLDGRRVQPGAENLAGGCLHAGDAGIALLFSRVSP